MQVIPARGGQLARAVKEAEPMVLHVRTTNVVAMADFRSVVLQKSSTKSFTFSTEPTCPADGKKWK